MDILFIANGVPLEDTPLIGIFEFDQAKALLKDGHNVIFLGVDLRSFRHRRKYGITHGEMHGIKWYKIDIPIGAVPIKLRCEVGSWALKKLYNFVYKNNKSPDLFHAHFTEPGYMAVKLNKGKKIPLIITEHSSAINKENISESLRKCATYTYSNANSVIAVSGALKNNIKKNSNVEAEVVPNIISVEDFLVDSIPHKGFGFVVTANLVEGKGHKLLLEAFSEVQKKYKDVYLGIIGEGNLREKLKKQMYDLNLGDSVKFYGQIPRKDIGKIYQEYDCFVLPSESETFGVAYVEAMVAGIPVIATRCGGPEDFVTNQTGFLVKVNDKLQLINAMCKMYLEKHKFNQHEISLYARSLCSAENISKKLVSIYTRNLREK